MTKAQLEKVQSLVSDMAKTFGSLSELRIAEKMDLQGAQSGVKAGIFIHEVLLQVIAEELKNLLITIYGDQENDT